MAFSAVDGWGFDAWPGVIPFIPVVLIPFPDP